MVKTRFVGIIFCCFMATTGWAETSSPSLIITSPQPKWSDLEVPQRIVLAPLSDDWDSLEYYRQKKWINIAARFPSMTPSEQRRIQGQMQEWGKLSQEQRELARENFKTASQLPAEKKLQLKKKWEEYSSLPAEEKEKLKQESTNKPAIKPSAPATPTLLPPTPVTAKQTVSEIVQLPQPAAPAEVHEQLPQPPATPSAETTTTAP